MYDKMIENVFPILCVCCAKIPQNVVIQI